MRYTIYDIESLSNYFCYADITLDGKEIHVFEISKFKNEISNLFEYYKTLGGQVGFNCLAYDAQVIHWLLTNYKTLSKLDGESLAKEIYAKSNEVIQRANSNQWPEFNEKVFKVKQLDLFKVWHYDNKARMCGLKWLQFGMDWYNLEEMPIPHWTTIDDEKTAADILSYCLNDIKSTREFYNITIGKTDNKLYKDVNKISLRKDVESQFKFNCLNYSDVKIGDEIMKSDYLKNTGLDFQNVKNSVPREIKLFNFGSCFPSYMKFESKELNSFIESIRNIVVDLYNKQDFKLEFGTSKYTFAKGGLHSNDTPRILIPKNNEILRDADVGSMYPNAIRKRKLFPRHLGEQWLTGYSQVIESRLEAKKLFKQSKDKKYKAIDEAYKLALNGGSFGKTNQNMSWQFDPFVTMCVTIGCQIDLLMLIEKFELNGIRVMSANTDGVVCLFRKDQESKYNELCEEWEKIVGNNDLGKLEYADYKLYAQTSVNDYIAIKEDGIPKHKGDFMVDFELHKNKSARIVPLALEAFYVSGINPRTFILNHKNIFDFCLACKSVGSWHYEYRGFKDGEYFSNRLQKINRYYISNSGGKLVKCNTDGRLIQEDAGQWVCTIYNKHEDKPFESYDINYDYYVRKVYEIISNIQPEIVSEKYIQLSIFQ